MSAEPAVSVDVERLASLLGKSVATVHAWAGEGIPTGGGDQNGDARLYDPASVIQWYQEWRAEQVHPGAERDEADLAVRQAKAQMARLDLAEREGKLIPVTLHEKLLGAVLGEVRARILNLPGSVAPQLVGLEEERDVVVALRPAIDRCLQSLVELADELEDSLETSGEEP